MSSETFVRVPSTEIQVIEHQCYTRRDYPEADLLADRLGLEVVTDDEDIFSVFRWRNPLTSAPLTIEYPSELRTFTPVSEITGEEISRAQALIRDFGPVIPLPIEQYRDGLLARVEELAATEREEEVPVFQARGFERPGIYTFRTPRGIEIKFNACTKGSGMTGYWWERRSREMQAALEAGGGHYPLNPDTFHARDHTGKSNGQKKGDDITWVGGASFEVTQREVAGAEIYASTGIFAPLTLPVRRFDQLPIGTGELIDAKDFTDQFDSDGQLVCLAKAWGMGSRVWNHIIPGEVIQGKNNITSAGLLSTQVDGRYLYEYILEDLTYTAEDRRNDLDKDENFTREVMETVREIDINKWKEVFGHAGEQLALAGGDLVDRMDYVLPLICGLNMEENVVIAGARRLYGKPVAWHLENVGHWGEVSGGERIYGMAEGLPNCQEFNSFFAYFFDGYSAIALEYASAGQEYLSIDSFFDLIRTRVLRKNPEHWIEYCGSLDQLVELCRSHAPDYEVQYRGEDAYPLQAVGETADACVDASHPSGLWKDWEVLKGNLDTFVTGVRQAYTPHAASSTLYVAS